MTKKLFYTKPLAAEYMAKELGVKYTNESGAPLKYLDGNWYVMWSSDSPDLYTGRFYIHPDSYRILEPQEGDIVNVDMPERIEVGEVVSDGLVHISEYHALHDPKYGDIIKIIQRNNKPFFWPESEV